jgi:hypothetical protein
MEVISPVQRSAALNRGMFSRIAFPWCFGAQKDQVTKRFGAEMIKQGRRKRRNPNIKTSREE